MKVDKLTRQCFEEHALWCFGEGYDYYEPEKTNQGVIDLKAETCHIRAKITLNNGDVFDGYVLDERGTVYLLVLFVNDEHIVKIERRFTENSLRALFAKLESGLCLKLHDIFPVNYETEFNYRGKARISGQFELPRLDD